MSITFPDPFHPMGRGDPCRRRLILNQAESGPMGKRAGRMLVIVWVVAGYCLMRCKECAAAKMQIIIKNTRKRKLLPLFDSSEFFC